MIVLMDQEVNELTRIIDGGMLTPVFQPIVDCRARTVLAFEALIRGPKDSALHLPGALFATARRAGLGLALEHAAREASLRAFAAQQLPGRLFLNASPNCLLDPLMMNGHTRELLRELNLPPTRIVIELTENEKVTDVPGILEALQAYRARGFQIAIDDLGEGFANLRMWSELRPEFVKIDRHFIDGIADDRIKYHFVRAMQDLAEICNASLVAEGIERAEDLACIRDMGIACVQGYFIAHPEAKPVRQIPAAALAVLGQRRMIPAPLAGGVGTQPTVLDLAREIEPVSPDTCNESVVERFMLEPELEVLPVVAEDGVPVGLINRHNMMDNYSRRFRKEIFGRKSCDIFMDGSPLVVEDSIRVQELAMLVAHAPKHHLIDGFIVTTEGRYRGVGSSHALIGVITEMQIHAARYANPLSQLPGNVPINEYIDRMLTSGISFVAAYIDIDDFKPFNDTFGYRRGDDVIITLAQLICEAVDTRLDFVGHIGGDDFFVVFQSADWEQRSWDLVANFAEAMGKMISGGEWAQGGYMAENRLGEMVFQRLPRISIGAVRIVPGECDSHREVAAAASAAKKHAKKLSKQGGDHNGPGGHLFVERRRLGCRGNVAVERLAN